MSTKTSRSPRSGKFMSFVIMIGQEELDQYEGLGLTLDDAVENELRTFEAGFGHDVSIWSGGRLMAALIDRGDKVEVVRFPSSRSEA